MSIIYSGYHDKTRLFRQFQNACQIIDDLKNETSKEIIENMKIIFEGNVNIVPKK